MFWPKRILEARWMKSTRYEAQGEKLKVAQLCFTKYNVYKTYQQGPARELQNQLHSSQYWQYIYIWCSSLKVLPLASTHSWNRQIIPWKEFVIRSLRDSRDLGGQKMSPLLLMACLEKQPQVYVMLNLIMRDLIRNCFQGMIWRSQGLIDAQGSTYNRWMIWCKTVDTEDESSWWWSSLDDVTQLIVVLHLKNCSVLKGIESGQIAILCWGSIFFHLISLFFMWSEVSATSYNVIQYFYHESFAFSCSFCWSP